MCTCINHTTCFADCSIYSANSTTNVYANGYACPTDNNANKYVHGYPDADEHIHFNANRYAYCYT